MSTEPKQRFLQAEVFPIFEQKFSALRLHRGSYDMNALVTAVVEKVEGPLTEAYRRNPARLGEEDRRFIRESFQWIIPTVSRDHVSLRSAVSQHGGLHPAFTRPSPSASSGPLTRPR